MTDTVFHPAVTVGHLSDAILEGLCELAGDMDHATRMKVASALYYQDPAALGIALFPLLNLMVHAHLQPICESHDGDPDVIARTEAERYREQAIDASLGWS